MTRDGWVPRWSSQSSLAAPAGRVGCAGQPLWLHLARQRGASRVDCRRPAATGGPAQAADHRRRPFGAPPAAPVPGRLPALWGGPGGLAVPGGGHAAPKLPLRSRAALRPPRPAAGAVPAAGGLTLLSAGQLHAPMFLLTFPGNLISVARDAAAMCALTDLA